jgi:hypothetical protein
LWVASAGSRIAQWTRKDRRRLPVVMWVALLPVAELPVWLSPQTDLPFT